MAVVHQARVAVVHVTSEHSPAVRREVERFVAAAVPEGSIAVEVHLVAGTPRDAILTTADALGSDAIVLGTHGRTGRERMLAGSVAESVVRGSARPVITVREPA